MNTHDGWERILIPRQDIAVLLFYYLGYSRFRNFIYRIQHKPATLILTFHDVADKEIASFKNKMLFLKHRTHIVSLDDFFSGRLSALKPNIIITFDDGYPNWSSHLIPLLKSLKMSATFFVSSGCIDESIKGQSRLSSARRVSLPEMRQNTMGKVGRADVRRIAEEGFAVGGHTISHLNLARLTDRSRVEYEIIEDKMRLEDITGKAVDYFAYPSGAFQNPAINIINILQQTGYKGAVTTNPGFNYVGSNPYTLHRELTRASMHEQVFQARALGNYAAVTMIKNLFDHRAEINHL